VRLTHGSADAGRVERSPCYARFVAQPEAEPERGTLHLVAVPIGNLDDLGPRARRVLSEVAVVAAEDTRHFATLARHHGLDPRAVSYHDHNEEGRTRELLARLHAGDDVALVTDAGTPLVSDPGFRLVRAAIDAGITVTSLPGPSAVTTALPAIQPRSSPSRLPGAWPMRWATRSRSSATGRHAWRGTSPSLTSATSAGRSRRWSTSSPPKARCAGSARS
jgi:Tetrapyrrole (Corrin/Porphyrin) Methylases